MEIDQTGGESDVAPELMAALNIRKEKRKFNAKLYGRTIQKGFSKLWKDSELSDLTLVLGDEKVPVHKMVLCAWSETFRAMLEMGSNWAESKQKELEVNLDESEYVHFKQILEYMYTGSADFIEGSNVVPLIALSNYYGIDALKEVCGKLLGDHVSEDNLFFLLDIVDKYNCTELAKECGSFLASNFAQMWADDESRLLSLSPDTWAAMLASDELAINSERAAWDAIMTYVAQFKNDPAKKDEVLSLLLPNLRFNALSAEFLISIEEGGTLSHLPVVEKLLFETYRYRACASTKLKTTFNPRPRRGFQKWSTNEKAPGVQLSNESLTATSSNGGWETVRAEVPVSHGQPYFEINIDTYQSNIMLGVCIGTIAFNSYAGQYNNGWTLHGTDGNFYHIGSNTMKSLTFTTGDKIGVYVDIDNGTLTYYKNGTKSFTASGLTPLGADNIYPVVSFAGASNKVTIASRPELPKDLVGVVPTKRMTYGKKKN